MLWLALLAAGAVLTWWSRRHAQARCRDCGSRAVLCSFPFVCAARRRGLVEARAEDDPAELPPPEELL